MTMPAAMARGSTDEMGVDVSWGMHHSTASSIGIFGSGSDHVQRCRRSKSRRKHRAHCHPGELGSRSYKHSHSRGASPTPHVFTTLQAASVNEAQAIEEAEIEQILETPCQNTRLTPNPENLTLIREATLCLINQERARNHEPPLQQNPALQQAAEAHSQDMVTNNYFSHTAPNGLGPAERILQTSYIPNPEDGYDIGENIAWAVNNQATPQAIVTAWINSPDHLENILEPNYHDTAIGITPAAPPTLARGRPGATYTQDFGVVEG